MAEVRYKAAEYDEQLNGKVAVIGTRWNFEIVEGLVQGYKKGMELFKGVSTFFFEVSGAWEIPLKADQLLSTEQYDVVVVFGCVVKGETRHAELVMNECARGCMNVQLKQGVPIVFEVLGVDNLDVAKERSGDSDMNAGQVAAMTVLDLLSPNPLSGESFIS